MIRRFINYLKKIRKDIAIYFTISYANRSYRKMVKLADKKHLLHKEKFYVAIAFDSTTLRVYNRELFRHYRDRYEHSAIYRKDVELLYNVMKLKVKHLEAACFYRTPDRSGNGWTPDMIEQRRLALIEYVLRKAGLK